MGTTNDQDQAGAPEPGRDGLPETFAGFRVLKRVGRGVGGVVWKVSDPASGRELALKLMIGRLRPAAADLERIGELVELRGKLAHPGLAPILALGEDAGRHYITMEWIEGVPLDGLLDAGLLNRRQGLELLEKIARALEHAHAAGVVHRDLKPANIIVGTDAEPRVTDFDLAMIRRESGSDDPPRGGGADSGVLVGTPCYMAPEQATGEGRRVDGRADVYSLGCILYELLAGRRPFDGGGVMEIARRQIDELPVPPGRLRADVPPDIEAVCLRCLEKSPGERYDSARELAEDLRRFLDGLPVAARATRAAAIARRRRRHRRLLAALAAALGVLALAAGLSGRHAAALALGGAFGTLCVWLGLASLKGPRD